MQTVHLRTKTGGTVAEFGMAFIVLVCFFFIPLVNLGFIAARYLIAQGIVNEYAHRLAITEKRSDSYALMTDDHRWSSLLAKCGMNVDESTLKLIVCGKNPSDQVVVSQGVHVSTPWLPEGSKGPCVYVMEFRVKAKMLPVYTGGPAVPGISAPLPIDLAGRAVWENLACNPDSKEYYINE